MKVSLSQVKKLFVAMGYPSANGWDVAKATGYVTKAGQLEKMAKKDGAKPLTDPGLKKLFKELTADPASVEVTEEGADAALAKATGGKKGAAKAEAPAAKTEGGKKKIEKAGGEKGPGIIASIVEILQAAHEEAPESKESIADKLAKRFPDRDRDSMLKTVSVQVPNRIQKEKGLTIEKVRKDGRVWYWINVVPAGKKGK